MCACSCALVSNEPLLSNEVDLSDEELLIFTNLCVEI